MSVLLEASATGFVFSLGIFALGLYLIRKGFDSFRIAALVKNTATESAGSVAMGRTELKGRARPLGQPFIEPFGEDECVYANWSIEEYKRSGDDTRWKFLRSGNCSERFVLEDDTGAVVIEEPHIDDPSFPINDQALPTGALSTTVGREFAFVSLEDDYHNQIEVDAGERPPPQIADWCERLDIDPIGDHPRRYTQAVMVPGHEVYVYGMATRYDSPSAAGVDTDVLVKRDEDTGLFILTDMSEKEAYRTFVKQSPIVIAIALFFSIGGLVGLLTSIGLA